MKKFFAKKWALISFAVASVIFVGGLLAMLLCPVFFVGSYKGGSGNQYYNYTYHIHFTSPSTYEVTNEKTTLSTGETKTETTKYWYYRKGNIIFALGSTEDMTKAEYKEAVKELKNLKGEEYDAVVESMGAKINLRYMRISTGTSSVSYSNKASIPFLIIDSILTALALAGTGLSTYFFVKGRKNKLEPAAE